MFFVITRKSISYQRVGIFHRRRKSMQKVELGVGRWDSKNDGAFGFQ